MGKNAFIPERVFKNVLYIAPLFALFFVAQGTNFGYIHISFVTGLLDQIWWWLIDLFL